ncbi:cation:proton antiporter [Castellaniella caeni]|uniref:cation:proton antiporter n=1 Tax=Castellaniella caeni TaxID=266123 RepID=UPI000830CDC5|nr:sodium:proton antiporter [Castellaniella caeni]
MTNSPEILLAGIGIVAMAAQWLAWRLRVPAILFLLLAGIAVGPVAGWLDPDGLFGHLLFPIVSLSVAVILFEGSLTLEFHQTRGLERVVRRLVSGGLLITWGVSATAVHFLLDFPWDLAVLFGAITAVTGPTVIAPLLKTVKPVAPVAHALRWEGILIDPIGAILAVLSYDLMVALRTSHAWGHALWSLGATAITGLVFGLVAGWLLGMALRKGWIPDSLLNLSTLATVFAAFALSNTVQSESGLLAVTIMGIWLANRPGIPVHDILEFKETLSQILLSSLFILLAARVAPAQLFDLGWPALAVLVLMLWVGRPLKVLFSTWGSKLNWRERALLTWIAPRGIVAAAVSALFALRLESLQVPQAEKLLPLTFLVIIGTVIWQSITARPMAKLLKAAEPDRVGFLISGANPVARAIGQALYEQGVPVRLCDSDWYSLSKARMLGLPTYHGSPISEHAQHNLDTSGLGRLLALGTRDHVNQLIMVRGRDEFGKNKVFSLPRSRDGDAAEKHAVDPEYRGRTLFAVGLGYWALSSLLMAGAQVKTTKLSETFTFAQYQQAQPGHAVYPLFAINPKGYAMPFTLDQDLQPQPGWTVIGLHVESAQAQPAEPLAA